MHRERGGEANVWWRHLGAALLDLAYPIRCGGCDAVGEGSLCARCAARCAPIVRLGCQRCGLPAEPGSRAATLCPRCVGGRPFDLARAAFLYREPLRGALHRLKFGGRISLGTGLADLLVEAVSEPHPGSVELRALPFDEIDFVCPVPLHPARERQRGFNQAELLGRPVSEALGKPFEARLLVRVRETRPQFGLRSEERLANVEGAFGHLSSRASIAGLTVLIVDDIITTGATVGACARALRAGGAARVFALSLCRPAAGDETTA